MREKNFGMVVGECMTMIMLFGGRKSKQKHNNNNKKTFVRKNVSQKNKTRN